MVDVGRAGVARQMRRSVEDVLVVRQKIAAGGAALARRDHVLIGAVGVHHVLLIAFPLAARGLKDQPFAVRRPVGFGVFAAIGQLTDVGQEAAARFIDGQRQPANHHRH